MKTIMKNSHLFTIAQESTIVMVINIKVLINTFWYNLAMKGVQKFYIKERIYKSAHLVGILLLRRDAKLFGTK